MPSEEATGRHRTVVTEVAARLLCIGCGACAAVCPDPWLAMVAVTGAAGAAASDSPPQSRRHRSPSEAQVLVRDGVWPEPKWRPERNLHADLFKGCAILTILFWHCRLIPAWAFVWAIPVFVLVTAALYQDRLATVSPGRILLRLAGVFAIVVVFTIVADKLAFPCAMKTAGAPYWSVSRFVLRNPYLGYLWYLLLYAQIVVVLGSLGVLCRKQRAMLPEFSRWGWGAGLLMGSLAFSYVLLALFGQGLTINVFSWSFVLWIGLFRYRQIRGRFEQLSSAKLLVVLAGCGFLLAVGVVGGGQVLADYLEKRTHDFILPAILLQSGEVAILFALVTLLVRHVRANLLAPLAWAGRYSLYLYVFHYFLYTVVFYPLLGRPAILAVIPTCIMAGWALQSVSRGARLFFSKLPASFTPGGRQ